jgi:hypothetical protein
MQALGTENAMFQTIQVSSCVSAQGLLVEHLPNGEVVIRDGGTIYRGRPIAPFSAPDRAAASLRAVGRAREV